MKEKMEILNHIELPNDIEQKMKEIDTQNIDKDALLTQTKEDIERCVALIMGRYKFFGEFIYKFRILYTYRVQTMATDGKNFFVNPLFCSLLNDKQIVFILCHEILHNVMVHFLRQENKGAERERWNHATDHEINLMLVEEGLLSVEQVLQEIHGLCDTQYKEMTAEEIYDKLPEIQKPKDFVWPVEVGSVVKAKSGKYGVVEAINTDGTYDIKEITQQEAKELVNNQCKL
jgi:predicted metal-dependent peptidase